MLKKKSIVLSDVEKGTDKKAVLFMEEDGSGLHGTLRLYNFPREPLGISSLGLYCSQKVYKAGLTLKSNMLYEFFLDLKNIPNKFSCAIVNFQNAEAAPILYGSSEGSADDVYGSIITEMAGDNSLKHTKDVLDKYGVDFDEDEKEIVEKEIDNAMCGGNCADCVYKKYFFENNKNADVEATDGILVEASSERNHKEDFVAQRLENDGELTLQKTAADGFQEADDKTQQQDEQREKLIEGKKGKQKKSEIGERTDEETEIVFFDRLKPQIDKLFEENPAEDNLQDLIPSSKWVKVEYEDDGDFYVFGLLYDEDENVRYVCYGVPAVFEENPPKELAGYPIWLPLNENKRDGFGYWLTYQDAATGEPVKAIID